jgi:hypothetical protein
VRRAGRRRARRSRVGQGLGGQALGPEGTDAPAVAAARSRARSGSFSPIVSSLTTVTSPSPGAVTRVMTPRRWRKRRMRLLARSTTCSTSCWEGAGAGWNIWPLPSPSGSDRNHDPCSSSPRHTARGRSCKKVVRNLARARRVEAAAPPVADGARRVLVGQRQLVLFSGTGRALALPREFHPHARRAHFPAGRVICWGGPRA